MASEPAEVIETWEGNNERVGDGQQPVVDSAPSEPKPKKAAENPKPPAANQPQPANPPTKPAQPQPQPANTPTKPANPNPQPQPAKLPPQPPQPAKEQKDNPARPKKPSPKLLGEEDKKPVIHGGQKAENGQNAGAKPEGGK